MYPNKFFLKIERDNDEMLEFITHVLIETNAVSPSFKKEDLYITSHNWLYVVSQGTGGHDASLRSDIYRKEKKRIVTLKPLTIEEAFIVFLKHHRLYTRFKSFYKGGNNEMIVVPLTKTGLKNLKPEQYVPYIREVMDFGDKWINFVKDFNLGMIK